MCDERQASINEKARLNPNAYGGAVSGSGSGHYSPGLRTRMQRKLYDLQEQVKSVERDLAILDATPIIEHAADLSTKY